MILTDTNVLVYAHREDAADHRRFRKWLETLVGEPEALGVARVVTHPASSTRRRRPGTALDSAVSLASSQTR